MSFFGELKRRKVVRAGLAYAVIAWLLAQVAALALDAFEAPPWVMKAVLVFLVLGMPLALFLAWVFELSPEGLRREKDVDRGEPVPRINGVRTDRIVALVMAAFVVLIWVAWLYPGPEDEPASTAGQQSIAVLPFVNMSGDDDYFADGLSEELLNLLARMPDLKVAGRTSSFQFKGRNEDLREIGAALGVEHVLEGSVRRSGERLRITAQLIKVKDGFHVWSETYDREMTDIFDIQDDVASSIADALRLRLAPQADRPTKAADAYALYLNAVAVSSNLGDGNIDPIIGLLDQALALDPGFAKAHELKAMAYWSAGGWTLNAPLAQRLTYESANAALALDPALLGARALLISASQDGGWAAEISALEAAYRASPNVPWLLDFLAYDYQSAGYYREALDLSERLIGLEPLASAGYLRKAAVLGTQGKRAEARRNWQRAYELGAALGGRSLAVDHVVAGEYDQAREWLRRDPDPAIAEVDEIDTFFEGALAPDGGKAFLVDWVDARAGTADDFESGLYVFAWLAYFECFDEFWDRVGYLDTATLASWDNTDALVNRAMVFKRADLAKHPRFLPYRRGGTMVDLWESRGAPDFCNKDTGEWVCE